MNTLRLAVSLLFAILCVSGARGAEPGATATPSRPLRLLVVGDSTVCDYDPMSPRCGWGQLLPSYLNKTAVRLVNQAVDGTSTKSFIAKGLWAKALAARADIILIQFGHNDSVDPSDPRATNAATEFPANLRKFIDTARAGGATPILVTPMRHTSMQNGALRDDLAPYAAAMRAVAAEKKAPLVDLYVSSTRLFLSLGAEGLAAMRSERDDNIHFNLQGAKAIAGLVADELPKADPRFAGVMVHPVVKPAR